MAAHALATAVASVAAAVGAIVFAEATRADGPLYDDLIGRVAESLTTPDPDVVQAARRETQESLDSLRRQLAEHSIGAVLHEELAIDALATELERPQIDAAALSRLERPLRRVVAGRTQATVNRLRSRVQQLARLVRLASDGRGAGVEALGLLSESTVAGAVGNESDDVPRRAFETLAAFSPARSDLLALRRRVSTPNVSTSVSASFVDAISRRRFEQSVDFRTSQGGASISGRGSVSVTTSASAPPSRGSNRLTLHAHGSGTIDARADRRRVHVRAVASPSIVGQMDLDLFPDRVVSGSPHIDARFRTAIAGVGIEGVLGRCRVVQRLAGRAVSRAVVSNDPVVAGRIQTEVAKRLEEEGKLLAQRVSGLLRHGLWERLAALDYSPEVRAWNDETGLHAETLYANEEQLGALSPPPAGGVPRLDVMTRVHESAINNTLATLGGLVLDENTARGIWEVQLKVTSEEWSRLPSGREPAVITFADDQPALVRLRDGGIDITLRLRSCLVAGRLIEGNPVEVRCRYQLERHSSGWRLVRRAFEHARVPATGTAEIWDRVIGLFFPPTIEPMPRYRPAGFSEYLRTQHLDISSGWLTVGGARVDPGGATVSSSSAGMSLKVPK